MLFIQEVSGTRENEQITDTGFFEVAVLLSADRYQWLLNFVVQWILNKTGEWALQPLPVLSPNPIPQTCT